MFTHFSQIVNFRGRVWSSSGEQALRILLQVHPYDTIGTNEQHVLVAEAYMTDRGGEGGGPS